jgi:hypothetical protein|tara:strand:- start:222 stop:329 length:108 start_codon:yes stop_codon:yes gene_type:complete
MAIEVKAKNHSRLPLFFFPRMHNPKGDVGNISTRV